MDKNQTEENSPQGLLGKSLAWVTEVHAHEIKIALLLTLTIFLILASYLTAKVVREPLILSGGGAELKSYASAFQVLLLLMVVRMYTKCVCTFNRKRLLNTVTLMFAGCLVMFWAYLVFVGPMNGIIFYLWTGVFSLVIIAQFWSLANDVYSPEQGKRLFVLLAFGASAGGVFGPMLAGALLDLVGLYNLLLVSAAMLVSSLLLINYIEPRIHISEEHCKRTAGQEADQGEVSHRSAMAVLFANRYLIMIAFLILLTNWVNTTGEYILGRSVAQTAEAMFAGDLDAKALERAFIGRFYADFFSVVGFAGLLIQLFIVSRVVKYLGIRVALMILPIIALGSYATMMLIPALGFVRWAKTAENSTDYSLNSTVRQILFLPTTREEKYKAKLAIDTIFVRLGDLFSAGLVFVGAGLLSFSISQFAAVSAGLVIIWLVLAYYIGKENHRLVNSGGGKQAELT